MKVLLVTIVDNNNIGTALQIYSTVRLIEERGHEVVVLQYIRSYLFGKEYALNLWKNKNWAIRHLFALYYVWINRNRDFLTIRFLRKQSMKITRPFYSVDELKREDFDYDLYVTGSDQVWNMAHNNNRFDEAYFLSFVKGNKVSYAASIGMDKIPIEYAEIVRNYLSEYTSISVRESQAVDILNDIGIVNVKHVLDPTLLLTDKDWDNIAKNVPFVKESPYLLIYSVEEKCRELICDISSAIAAEKHLKIFEVSGSNRHGGSQVDRFVPNTSPELFLNLFKNADFAIVSSFHGTAFSINYNIQFITVAPDRFSSRVKSLLAKLGLDERYVISGGKIPKELIDFSIVNSRLNSLRAESAKYLDSVLNV
jgi:hypothetical protein